MTEQKELPQRPSDLAMDIAYRYFNMQSDGQPETLASLIDDGLREQGIAIPMEPDDYCAVAGDCQQCPHPDNCLCSHHAPAEDERVKELTKLADVAAARVQNYAASLGKGFTFEQHKDVEYIIRKVLTDSALSLIPVQPAASTPTGDDDIGEPSPPLSEAGTKAFNQWMDSAAASTEAQDDE